jgi:hypothetical protein
MLSWIVGTAAALVQRTNHPSERISSRKIVIETTAIPAGTSE